MKRYLLWAFWSAAYLFRREPNDLRGVLSKSIRTRSPWWKFQPHVWHNEDGGYWEIVLSSDSDYTRRVAIPDCEISISRETGHIVGVKLYDEILRQPDECPPWFGPNKQYVG